MNRLLSIGVVFLLGTLASCGSGGGEASPCLSGKEGCPCYPNKTCNNGLSCKSSLCVNLGDEMRSPARSVTSTQMSAPVDGAQNSRSSAGSSSASDRSSNPLPQAGEGANPPKAPQSSAVDAGTDRQHVSCTPRCDNAECGPDPVCQTSCGECASGLSCKSGVCTAPAPLRRNGETCADDKDCASSLCGRDRAGERLCYGTLNPNEACRDPFDCTSGVCIPKVAGSSSSVCVDGLAACDELGILDSCTTDLAVATCQFNELCGNAVGDFNSCIRYGCMYWHDNPPATGCPGQLSFVRGGRGNCQNRP